MKLTTITIPSDKKVIQPSSWPKKELADVHVELLKLCGFGCTYCSSNMGMQLKMRKQTISKAHRKATGKDFNPHDAGDVAITLDGVLESLERQLSGYTRPPGEGKTLVLSQLTDGFSPQVLKTGTTRRALEMLLEGTKYRIRVLTKNAIVGRPEWIRFFAGHADRFVVGLSIGTLDDGWARKVECLTSVPSSRVKALRKLQDAGVPTFGMLCPMFPEVLDTDHLECLAAAIRPDRCEHVWSEPFNDRQNWEDVRACYPPGTRMWHWLTDVFERDRQDLWSEYATELYTRLLAKARRNEWTDKLRYLLYEDKIIEQDSAAFSGLDGVLLQCKPADDGQSRNPHFARFQRTQQAKIVAGA